MGNVATSVLDQMTADVSSVKRAAALTPVGTEKGAHIPDVPEVFLTNEAVRDIAKDLRRMTALLVEAADGLDRLTGMTETPTLVITDKKLERFAGTDPMVDSDADLNAALEVKPFVEDFADKQARAQAATFTANDAPAAEPEPAPRVVASGSPKSNWVCPEHGDKALTEKTSGKGRTYRICTLCAKFEK